MQLQSTSLNESDVEQITNIMQSPLMRDQIHDIASCLGRVTEKLWIRGGLDIYLLLDGLAANIRRWLYTVYQDTLHDEDITPFPNEISRLVEQQLAEIGESKAEGLPKDKWSHIDVLGVGPELQDPMTEYLECSLPPFPKLVVTTQPISPASFSEFYSALVKLLHTLASPDNTPLYSSLCAAEPYFTPFTSFWATAVCMLTHDITAIFNHYGLEGAALYGPILEAVTMMKELLSWEEKQILISKTYGTELSADERAKLLALEEAAKEAEVCPRHMVDKLSDEELALRAACNPRLDYVVNIHADILELRSVGKDLVCLMFSAVSPSDPAVYRRGYIPSFASRKVRTETLSPLVPLISSGLRAATTAIRGIRRKRVEHIRDECMRKTMKARTRVTGSEPVRKGDVEDQRSRTAASPLSQMSSVMGGKMHQQQNLGSTLPGRYRPPIDPLAPIGRSHPLHTSDSLRNTLPQTQRLSPLEMEAADATTNTCVTLGLLAAAQESLSDFTGYSSCAYLILDFAHTLLHLFDNRTDTSEVPDALVPTITQHLRCFLLSSIQTIEELLYYADLRELVAQHDPEVTQELQFGAAELLPTSFNIIAATSDPLFVQSTSLALDVVAELKRVIRLQGGIDAVPALVLGAEAASIIPYSTVHDIVVGDILLINSHCSQANTLGALSQGRSPPYHGVRNSLLFFLVMAWDIAALSLSQLHLAPSLAGIGYPVASADVRDSLDLSECAAPPLLLSLVVPLLSGVLIGPTANVTRIVNEQRLLDPTEPLLGSMGLRWLGCDEASQTTYLLTLHLLTSILYGPTLFPDTDAVLAKCSTPLYVALVRLVCGVTSKKPQTAVRFPVPGSPGLFFPSVKVPALQKAAVPVIQYMISRHLYASTRLESLQCDIDDCTIVKAMLRGWASVFPTDVKPLSSPSVSATTEFPASSQLACVTQILVNSFPMIPEQDCYAQPFEFTPANSSSVPPDTGAEDGKRGIWGGGSRFCSFVVTKHLEDLEAATSVTASSSANSANPEAAQALTRGRRWIESPSVSPKRMVATLSDIPISQQPNTRVTPPPGNTAVPQARKPRFLSFIPRNLLDIAAELLLISINKRTLYARWLDGCSLSDYLDSVLGADTLFADGKRTNTIKPSDFFYSETVRTNALVALISLLQRTAGLALAPTCQSSPASCSPKTSPITLIKKAGPCGYHSDGTATLSTTSSSNGANSDQSFPLAVMMGRRCFTVLEALASNIVGGEATANGATQHHSPQTVIAALSVAAVHGLLLPPPLSQLHLYLSPDSHSLHMPGRHLLSDSCALGRRPLNPQRLRQGHGFINAFAEFASRWALAPDVARGLPPHRRALLAKLCALDGETESNTEAGNGTAAAQTAIQGIQLPRTHTYAEEDQGSNRPKRSAGSLNRFGAAEARGTAIPRPVGKPLHATSNSSHSTSSVSSSATLSSDEDSRSLGGTQEKAVVPGRGTLIVEEPLDQRLLDAPVCLLAVAAGLLDHIVLILRRDAINNLTDNILTFPTLAFLADAVYFSADIKRYVRRIPLAFAEGSGSEGQGGSQPEGFAVSYCLPLLALNRLNTTFPTPLPTSQLHLPAGWPDPAIQDPPVEGKASPHTPLEQRISPFVSSLSTTFAVRAILLCVVPELFISSETAALYKEQRSHGATNLAPAAQLMLVTSRGAKGLSAPYQPQQPPPYPQPGQYQPQQHHQHDTATYSPKQKRPDDRRSSQQGLKILMPQEGGTKHSPIASSLHSPSSIMGQTNNSSDNSTITPLKQGERQNGVDLLYASSARAYSTSDADDAAHYETLSSRSRGSTPHSQGPGKVVYQPHVTSSTNTTNSNIGTGSLSQTHSPSDTTYNDDSADYYSSDPTSADCLDSFNNPASDPLATVGVGVGVGSGGVGGMGNNGVGVRGVTGALPLALPIGNTYNNELHSYRYSGRRFAATVILDGSDVVALIDNRAALLARLPASLLGLALRLVQLTSHCFLAARRLAFPAVRNDVAFVDSALAVYRRRIEGSRSEERAAVQLREYKARDKELEHYKALIHKAPGTTDNQQH